MPVAVLLRLGMPLAMAISALLVWRAAKRENGGEAAKPAWRDDSLDDWRRERDEAAERERAERAAKPQLREGAERDDEVQERHQRIGG